MKRVVALLLTLALLLSVAGTAAFAAGEAKPTLPYPTVTATVDADGLLSVKFSDDVKDYQISLDLQREEKGTKYSTHVELDSADYDAKKKAYVSQVGKDWKDAKATSVYAEVYKSQDGKASDTSYRYEDGKISQVYAMNYTYKNKDSVSESVNNGRRESYRYNQKGEADGYTLTTMAGSGKSTYDSKTKKSESTSTSTSTSITYRADGSVESTGTGTSTWKSDNKEPDEKGNYEWSNSSSSTSDRTQNFWANSVPYYAVADKSNYSNKYTYEAYAHKASNESSHSEETVTNAKGVVIYKRVSDSAYTYDEKTNTSTSTQEAKEYDAYGNLLYGYSYSNKPAEETSSTYGKHGLTSTTTTQYATNKDGSRKTEDGYTQKINTEYDYEYGINYKSEETVTKPTKVTYKDKNDKEQSYTYDATTTTQYDPWGGVTDVKVYAENTTYDKTQKATISTQTTTTYVGKVGAGELKETTVSTQIKGENQTKNTTVKTNYAGAVVESTEESWVTTPASEKGPGTQVYTTFTTKDGKQTSGYSRTTVYNYDGNGHDYYTAARSNENGKTTQLTEGKWDAKEKKYVYTTSYNDENGILRGTYKSIGDESSYSDKDGKLLYKRATTKDGKAITYTDASGKEIGYEKADSYKIPQILYGKTTLALNGWTEWKREEQKDAKGAITYKTTNKTFDQAGNLLYENVDDGKANKTTETYYSKFDAKKMLATSEEELKDVGWTSSATYNENPGYVKSEVITSVPTEEKDSKKRITKRVDTTTTELYDLSGKLNRSTVNATTTTWTYKDDGSSTSATIYTTEWKDATGATVVTKTTNPNAKSGENSVEYKKADGTVIGYEKTTTSKSDGSKTTETVTADFNPYTGYVRSTEKFVEVTDKWGEVVKSKYETREGGVVTYSSTSEKTSTGYKGSSINYTRQVDGKVTKSSDSKWENNNSGDKKGQTSSGHTYYPSGKVASSWEGSQLYESTSAASTVKNVYKDADGNVSYTVEGTVSYVAQSAGTSNWQQFNLANANVRNLVYKDAKGNVIGYEKTDAKGTVTTKIPGVTYSGKLTKSWTESTTDVMGNTISYKSYNENGRLMYESYRQPALTQSTEYWKYTGQKQEQETEATNNGMTRNITSWYNEDGSLRKTTVSDSGRATGTHIYTSKSTTSNGAGTVMYTHETTEDLRTGIVTEVYKDAAGKEIGHVKQDSAADTYDMLVPDVGERTGKILGYNAYTKDKDGVVTIKEYDASMKLVSSTSTQVKNDKTEENYSTTSYYKDGNAKAWKVVTNYTDGTWIGGNYVNGGYTETDKYNLAGEKVAAQKSKSNNQSMVRTETDYYNQKGELVYSRLDIEEPISESGTRSGVVYLDAKGKEIGRYKTEDNGDSVEKTPKTTYANNITGYEETITSGNVTIDRKYDKDNKLVGETYRKGDVVIKDDMITWTTTKKDSSVVQKEIQYRDENLKTTKADITYYSRWDGKYEGEDVWYPATGSYRYEAHKHYNRDWNLEYYGWHWYEDDYDIDEVYWNNGKLMWYSWYDELGEDGGLYTGYNPDGSYAYWSEENSDGTSSEWEYGKDGVLDQFTEVLADGTQNITYYDKHGNVKGYDWGIKRTNIWGDGGLYAEDSVVWDANTALYTKHVEPDPDADGTVQTWKDYSGNVKVVKDSGTTVTLKNMKNGWQKAFGNEWYLIENGKMVTGWKKVDGAWYYFDKSGKMATGTVTEDKKTYALSEDGSWTRDGWNYDGNDNWEYVENGVVATGWRYIDGAWYYFDSGWYVDNSDATYDSEVGWKQGEKGLMVSGAADLWTADWSDKITYFFNEDGSWDDTPGWKTDGANVFYFYKGGDRAIGWRKIDGNWYYFNNRGVMRNGWVNTGSGWNYLDDATGKMVENQWVQEKFEDTWYFIDQGGAMATGWRLINGVWYYLKDDGAMASEEWTKSGGNWYYLKKDGGMATGWVEDKGNWYHLNASGAMEKGWVQDGGKWYYMDANGAMVTGDVTIDGKVNHFDENGAWISVK